MNNTSHLQLSSFLCTELAIDQQALHHFLSTAPNKYKIYSIPKRTSGKRIIAHPAKQLKIFQKSAIKHLETVFKIHPAAYAYRKGIGIKDNANCHRNNRYLLKMDFQNFFHCITPELLFFVSQNFAIKLSQDDQYTLKQLLFWSPSKQSTGKLILSIGAPSSPFVSNSILFFFDSELAEECKKQGIIYTRYADDLTFSTMKKDILFDIPILVKTLLSSHLDNYISINEAKTIFTSKAHNRHVTGITLTNNGKLSIGRKRKRYISSLIHQYSINQLPVEDINYLQGLLAFAHDIEPDFITRMEKKYSHNTIKQLRE